MKARNNERDIALIAKELGLEENLFTPTGEGIKGKVKELEKDINGVGKKVNGFDDRLKKLETNFSLPPPEETKESTSFLASWLLLKKLLLANKPILAGLGILTIYIIGKLLDVDININKD